MKDRPVRLPGPSYPIVITREPARIVMEAGGRILADTRRALILHEADYPPVHYIPREDADMSLLIRSESRTWCPYKGEASYFAIIRDCEAPIEAAWSYEMPHHAVGEIRELLAFYPDRIDRIRQLRR